MQVYKEIRVLVLLLLVIPFVNAASDEIPLVALAEKGEMRRGAVALLSLEVSPGSERVFLETFPLTRITTQGSMRFAQQMACEYLELDCSTVDFFFTIHAPPGIVSGPSAGSAAAVLTASVLSGQNLTGEVAITGTINSGGVIGPVGSILEKIDGATSQGIMKLAIPLGTRFQEKDNSTVDAIEYGKERGVEVVEVATLSDALDVFGISANYADWGDFSLIHEYASVMEDVAADMCSRVEQKSEFYTKAQQAIEENKTYSAASFCFRANVEARQKAARSWSSETVLRRAADLRSKTQAALSDVNQFSLTTLTDLQTAMAVWERLQEVDDAVDSVVNMTPRSLVEAASLLAYAEERFESAKSWSLFFGTDAGRVRVTEERLYRSCEQKLAEAQERFNYVAQYAANLVSQDALDIAYKERDDGRYWTCLYAAAKSKAEANTIMSVLGVHEEQLDQLFEVKRNAAQQALARAQKRGIFPILSYTYYEYATSLVGSDKANALLFFEYSLELANLEIYFDRSPWLETESDISPDVAVFFYGIGLGIVLAVIILASRRK